MAIGAIAIDTST